MNERSGIRFWVKAVALGLVGCFVYGLVHDALDGLMFTRSAPSWALWVVGLVLGGLGLLFLEGAQEWVFEPDRPYSTRPRRSTRITIAVLVLAVLAAGLWLAWRLIQ